MSEHFSLHPFSIYKDDLSESRFTLLATYATEILSRHPRNRGMQLGSLLHSCDALFHDALTIFLV